MKQWRGLFLDGGSWVGFAYMGLDLSAPPLKLGTFRARKTADPEEWEPKAAEIHDWLDDMVKRDRPDLIGFESPFVPVPAQERDDITGKRKGFQWNLNSVRFLVTVAGVFGLVAARHGIDCLEANSMTVKKVLAGHGHASKDDMRLACVDRGWLIADEHQADACGVGLHMITQKLEREGTASCNGGNGFSVSGSASTSAASPAPSIEADAGGRRGSRPGKPGRSTVSAAAGNSKASTSPRQAPTKQQSPLRSKTAKADGASSRSRARRPTEANSAEPPTSAASQHQERAKSSVILSTATDVLGEMTDYGAGGKSKPVSAAEAVVTKPLLPSWLQDVADKEAARVAAVKKTKGNPT